MFLITDVSADLAEWVELTGEVDGWDADQIEDAKKLLTDLWEARYDLFVTSGRQLYLYDPVTKQTAAVSPEPSQRLDALRHLHDSLVEVKPMWWRWGDDGPWERQDIVLRRNSY